MCTIWAVKLRISVVDVLADEDGPMFRRLAQAVLKHPVCREVLCDTGIGDLINDATIWQRGGEAASKDAGLTMQKEIAKGRKRPSQTQPVPFTLAEFTFELQNSEESPQKVAIKSNW